jgi:hypothetical protein
MKLLENGKAQVLAGPPLENTPQMRGIARVTRGSLRYDCDP